MRRLKCTCYIFVATLCVASSINIKSTAKDSEEVSANEPTSETVLPSLSESSEFAARLGVHENKKEVHKGFKPSVNFSERRKNSSAAASSKSPQISYPDPPADDKPVSESTNEDTPSQSVELKLLNEKENGESPTSGKEDSEEGYDGRARFPKIYYGEVSPPYAVHDDDRDPHEQSGPRHIPDKLAEDEPKYYYSKNYANKPSGNKKKRFEYKHEEQRHASEQHHEHRHHGSHEISQAPEKLDHHQHESDYHHDGYGNEGHHDQRGHGYGQDLGHNDHQYGYGYPDHAPHQGHKYRQMGHGVDVIGKALQVLIPSALLLTGVSALFPNRLHVPTNDYTTYNRRQKRSIDYNNRAMGPSSEMLGREHRSLDIELPELPESQEYNKFANNKADYGEYIPTGYDRSSLSNEFDIIPISNHQNYPSSKSDSYGQKILMSKYNDLPYIRRPSSPQEYDQYNYGPQLRDGNDFASPDTPNRVITEAKIESTPALPTREVDSETMGSVPTPTASVELPKKRQRRVRVRTGIRKMMRSRPLPTSTQTAISVEEFKPIPDTPIKDISIHAEQAAREGKKLDDLVSSFKSIEEPTNSYLKSFSQNVEKKQVDLSPDGPVMGLITSYAQHDKDSPACQKRALCDLGMRGSKPTASKFEAFLWSLATLVPDQFSKIYELEDVFKAIKTGECRIFQCASPNLDIQI